MRSKTKLLESLANQFLETTAGNDLDSLLDEIELDEPNPVEKTSEAVIPVPAIEQ